MGKLFKLALKQNICAQQVNAHEYYLLGYEKCKRTFTLDVYLKFDICAALVRNIKYNIWMDKHIADIVI
jgi:hypothetical protein